MNDIFDPLPSNKWHKKKSDFFFIDSSRKDLCWETVDSADPPIIWTKGEEK